MCSQTQPAEPSPHCDQPTPFVPDKAQQKENFERRTRQATEGEEGGARWSRPRPSPRGACPLAPESCDLYVAALNGPA